MKRPSSIRAAIDRMGGPGSAKPSAAQAEWDKAAVRPWIAGEEGIIGPDRGAGKPREVYAPEE